MREQKFHFMQPDLQLFYLKTQDLDEIRNKHQEYYILVLIKGKATLEYPDKISLLNSGQTFIANNSEKVKIHIKDKTAEYLEIRFRSKFFREIDNHIDLLRPFSHSQKDKIKIFCEETKTESFASAVNNTIRALSSLQSRALVLSAVLQLICELYYIQNEIEPMDLKETDSSFAKLYNYIMDHLFEKMTIQSVADGVFLSPRSVTNILRRISNMSFHEFVTSNRLQHAKSMISSNAFKLNQVASNCGFESYSTFFRAFKKEFGITPTAYLNQTKNS